MKFTLTVFPKGNSILSTKEPLTQKKVDQIREKFKEWHASNRDVLVVGEMNVVSSLDVELDIEPTADDDWDDEEGGE